MAALVPEALARTGEAWVPLLIAATLKGTVVLLLAMAALRLMRPAPAAWRHWVCVLALGGLLALPPLSAGLPGWGVLPGWGDTGGPRPHAGPPLPTAKPLPAASPDRPPEPVSRTFVGGDKPAHEATTPYPASGIPAALPPGATNPNLAVDGPGAGPADSPARGTRSPAATSGSAPTEGPTATPVISGSAAPMSLAQTPPEADARRTLRAWVFLGWLVGAACVALAAVAGAASLAWLGRNAVPVTDPRLLASVRRLSAELGVRRRVRLVQRAGAMPMTWGVVRPWVLVPAEAAWWPPARQRAVLLHELGHVRRADCLAEWVARAAVACYWFHPLAWATAARLRREREAACDDLVLRHGEVPSAYAEHLLHIAASAFGGLPQRSAVPIARPGGVEARLRAILDARVSRRSLTTAAAALLAAATIAVLLPLAMARAAAAPESPAPQAPPPTAPAAATQPSAADRATSSTRPAPTSGPATRPALRHSTVVGGVPHAVRVLDAAGRPVAGARLWLSQDYPSFPLCQPDQDPVMASADTAADGTAEVAWPAAVKTNLVVSAPGHAAEFVRAASLAPDRPYELRLSVGQPITGVVRRPGGEPVAGARVKAVRQKFLLDFMPEFAPAGTTDAQGRFALPHAGAGAYSVTAVVEAAAAAAAPPVYTEPAAVTVAVDQPPADVEMVARPGAAIKGRIVTAHNVQVGGRPVSLLVRLPNQTFREVKADPDGSFVVGGIPPGAKGQIGFSDVGDYLARAEWDGRPAACTTELATVRFDGLAPGVYDGLTVRLYKAARLEAVLTDEVGKPYEKASITVAPWQRMFFSDARGRISGKMPPHTDVTLEFSNASFDEFRPSLGPIRAGEGETVTKQITLRRLPQPLHDRELSGQVVDADGKPVAGAEVQLGNHGVLPRDLVGGRGKPGQPKPTWTGGLFFLATVKAGTDGRFRFDHLQPGRTDLWAQTEGVRWGWARDVDTGQQGVRIVLEPAPPLPTFEGTLVGADGAPAAGATVYLLNGDHNRPDVLAEAKADAAGRFSLRPAAAAPDRNHHMRLIARAAAGVGDGGAVTWKSVPRSGGTNIRLAFKPAATVAGRLVNKRGDPLPGAAVWMYIGRDPDAGELFFTRKSEPLAPRTTTGPDGSFTLAGLPRGAEVTVHAKHPEYGQGTAWYVRDVGPETRIKDVVAPDGVTISGVVRIGPDGRPAARAAVSLLDLFGDALATAQADPDGRYRLAGIGGTLVRLDRSRVTARLGDGPAWEGAVTIKDSLYAGDHKTGLDVVLSRSYAARQADWLARKSPPVPSRYRAAVVDDADPATEGKREYGDTLTLYDAGGAEVWRQVGLNVGWGLPAAADPDGGGVYVHEGPARRLTRFNAADGRVVWHADKLVQGALAVSPVDGAVWGLTGEGSVHGNGLVAFDRGGKRVGDWRVLGSGIAYSAQGKCFWVTGRKLTRVGPDGKVQTEAPLSFGWASRGLAVNAADGSVWVTEVAHPDVRNSQNRLHVVAADGRVRKQVELGDWHPGAIAVDAARETVWLSGSGPAGAGLRKLDLDGRTIAELPVAGDLGVEPDTGCVWVAGWGGVYRLAPSGDAIWAKPEDGKREKAVVLLPPVAAP